MSPVLLLPGPGLALRQVLVHGRVVDPLSGRGLPSFDVAVELTAAGVVTRMPGRPSYKPDGWYAHHLVPGRELPAVPTTGPVTLTARITPPGRPPVEVSRQLDAAQLAPAEVLLDVDGASVRVQRVMGAPFDLSVEVPPSPVSVAGIVLRDHDAERPAAGVTVQVENGPSDVTAVDGRFWLSPMPVGPTATLQLSEVGGEDSTAVIRLDHSRPLHHVTLSRHG